jgi:hypothetical protein
MKTEGETDMTSPLCIHFTSFKEVRPKDMIVNDAA